MVEEHEVYPNAPIALVAVEITFPGEIGGPVPAGVQRAIGDVLGDDWVLEPLPIPSLTLNLGPAQPVMPPPPPGPSGLTILRYIDRERATAVALTAGSVSVETTRYRSWPWFRSTLKTVVETVEKLLRPDGVLRAGVRYIDEVRVDGVEGAGWGEWVAPSVLPPAFALMTGSGWRPTVWTGAAQYELGEDRYLVLRYGPQAAQPGFVVNPDGPLRRPEPRPVGPFFLFDFDASWKPSVVPRWDSAMLLETCDELRHPVRALFDGVLTERLVDQVFMRGRTSR